MIALHYRQPSHHVAATRSGALFPLSAPRPDAVHLADIAWHLSHIHRWCGATTRPVSVAEHSLFVAEILEREIGNAPPELVLAALLHDAHEAYTGDIITPVKHYLGDAYHNLERSVQRAIEVRFGVADWARCHAGTIKHCDHIAAATEARDLLPESLREYFEAQERGGARPVDWIDLRDREGMDASDWELAFVARAQGLASPCQNARLTAPDTAHRSNDEPR